MFLKRIELQGFKSFADKTVIQFDQDITCQILSSQEVNIENL